MIKIIAIEVEDLANAGCNNGQYPSYTLEISGGRTISGITCRCGRGCSNTDRLPSVGDEFDQLTELVDYLNN